MKELIIYDCDGVLFNSKKAVLAYYDFVCDTFGLTKIDRNNEELVNMAMMKTNEEILSFLTDSKEKLIEMLEFAKNMNFSKFLDLMEPEDKLIETLPKLKEKNYKLSIFTNRGYSLHYLLEHFNIDMYFDYKVTSLDVTKAKPNPEGLYKIFEYFSIVPEKTIYIGDSETDYLAAKSSGTPFLGYKRKFKNLDFIKSHDEIFSFI
ncbi:HAD-IA family hydrolase [Deferribacteraceae bacterium V6Fe1]|nr:HAD-IA family hydrolase [Deferribacteraceae bacterium V6Fe1]